MHSAKNYTGTLMIAVFIVTVFFGQPASAISAELAKKCREMALKEHPTARAGSKAGAGKAQQEYFRSCVAKNGKMD